VANARKIALIANRFAVSVTVSLSQRNETAKRLALKELDDWISIRDAYGKEDLFSLIKTRNVFRDTCTFPRNTARSAVD
jgi:hypothetical protein